MSKIKVRLPYEFDLLYDIKYMYEIENIVAGEPHCTDASLEDLVALLNDHGIELPDSLKGVRPAQEIWVLPDGTWLTYKPLEHEEPLAQKVKITAFPKEGS